MINPVTSLILLFIITGAIFLVSTSDLVSIFLSIELQSYGRAPGEAYTAEVFILSDIFGPLIWGYLPRVITIWKANNYHIGIADYKKTSQNGLPHLETCLSGDSHGQVNKFDTQKEAQLGPNVLSRILRHPKGNNNVDISSPYNIDCQKPFAYFRTEDTNAQSPKTINLNASVLQPRDPTASKYKPYLMRRRSFHSSLILAKGNSQKSLLLSTRVSNIKGAEDLNQKNGSKSIKSVSTWAEEEVSKYIRKDGKYNGLINIISNPLFLQGCYNEIKSKPGNMSKGTNPETLDGINIAWFDKIAKELKAGKFKFQPSRRVMIPKPGKKELRPLSVANPRDKIIQKAITVVLEAIWEKKFSNDSYGFRPERYLHQALYQLYRNGSNYQWVVQGDISKCFDKIPHKIINNIIESTVTCDKTLILIRKSLTAGYIDPDNGLHIIPSEGTPQGSVLSPLLANIVLNELDEYMTKSISTFEKGKKKARNKEYDKITSQIQWLQKSKPGSPEIKRLAIERRNIPSMIHDDPNFKRMKYLRYADDFVVLIAGSSDDAQLIKHRISDILLKKCGLELNKKKTIITATKDGFKFLGAWCERPSSLKAGLFTTKSGNPGKFRMRMRIMIPVKDLIGKLILNKFVKRNKTDTPTATARRDLVNLTHHEIITFYNHRIQGLVAFYSFACNLTSLRKIIMFLHLSCALTLALKYKLRTCRKVFKKYGNPFLTDPDTEIGLKIPKTLKVKHSYSGTDSASNSENILKMSWYKHKHKKKWPDLA
jgi:group II intron reverse transcriptase/maturase